MYSLHSLSIYKERSLSSPILQYLPDSVYQYIYFFYWQVTRVSPILTQFKGYVMKLGLTRRNRIDGKTEESCLLFKAKGEARCKYQTIIFVSE